jgi:hypothetical protein
VNNLAKRRSLLTAALAAAQLPETVPEVQMLRKWLDTWKGIGDVTVGMARQDYDLQTDPVR